MKVNIEERVAAARELFHAGYNCAQSVFLAYRDVAGFDEKTAATVSAPFGGRSEEHTSELQSLSRIS